VTNRFGARNGASSARFGMKGRNDGSICLARKMAQGHGHQLRSGVVVRGEDGVEIYSTKCKCGHTVIVRDGESPSGTALRTSCTGTSSSKEPS